MAAFDPKAITAALRVTGNTKLADELEGVQPSLQQQAPAQSAPVQQQPVAPPPQEAQPVEPAPQPTIEDKSWNPNAGGRALRGDVVAGQNRALDLAEQAGGALKAEGRERQAELLGELEGQRKSRLDTATGRVEGNRAQKDALEREMFARLDEISEREKNPPKDVMGMVMGILGAAMTAKGNQGGAMAANMLGQAMGSKSQQWARELESDKASVGRMRQMFDLQNDDSNNELDQEQKISTLMAGQFDAALKKVEAETDSKELKAAASQTRNNLRLQYAQHQLAVNAKKQAAVGSDALWKLSVEQLSQMMAQGQLGKEGQAVLTEKIKREQGQRGGEAEIEGKLASADKARADAAKAANEAGQPGAKKLTEGEAKTDSVVAGAATAYQRLANSIAKGNEVNRGAVRETWLPDVLTSQESLQQRADITNLVRSILRVESGSNVPESEVEGKIAALGIDSGDPEIRNSGMRQLLSGFQALDRQGRLGAAQSKQAAVAQAAQQPVSAAPATATVTVYRPDGRPVAIKPEFLDRMPPGWSRTPAQAQQPELTNASGLEQRMASERSAR
jgi:hypothetical protein